MTPGNLLFEYETALLVDSLTTRSFLIWSPSVKKKIFTTKILQESLQLTIYHHCIPSRYYLLPTAAHYLLPKTNDQLLTTYYLLPTTNYRLPTTYHLPTTYYLSPTICDHFPHTDNLKQSFDTHWIGLL